MNISVNQAISQVKPADNAAERFAREQARMERFKGMYEQDTARKAESEALMHEQMGNTDSLLDSLSPRGQEEMQAVIEEQKAAVEGELKKWGGDVDQFMRHGGTAMMAKYKNNIQGDGRYRNHLRAAGHIQELQEVMKAGKGNMISYSTQQDLARYQAGLIDTFEPKLINPIEIPADKYYEDKVIALKSILGENYQQFRSNFLVEHPDVDPTYERLYNYADNYYGEALGKKVDEMARIKARGSTKKGGKGNTMKPEDYTFSRNITSAFIKGAESNTIGLEAEALKNYWINGGHNLSTNFDLDSQYKWGETETGNTLQESYQMTQAAGGSLFNSWVDKSAYPRNEDGSVRISVSNLYDEDGIYGGGQRFKDDHSAKEINGDFVGVFLTKGNKNWQNKQGEKESLLYMKNEDEDTNAEALEGYQNKDGQDPGGRPMMVAAVRDKETEELFYVEIPAERADVSGLMEDSWGKMNNLGDDIEKNIREKKIEESIKQVDAKRVQAATQLYKTDLLSVVDDVLITRNLSVGHNVYGGVVAAMVDATMGMDERYQGLSGDAYQRQFSASFRELSRIMNDDLFKSESKHKKALLLAKDDGEAKEALFGWLREFSPEGYTATRSLALKYMNKFKA